MDNLRFLKWNKSVYYFCLFSISLFTPQVYAFNSFFYYGLADKTFLICLAIGFIVNCIFYLISKSEKIANTKNLLEILLFDFWFDDFVLRKFASFIYFISLSLFYGSVIYYLYEFFNSKGESPIFLGYLLITPIQLIVTRCLLEGTISLIKIAENTKPKKDLSDENQ